MIPIQEIDIYSDNDIKISARIVVPNDKVCVAEVIIYDPSHNELYGAYQTIGQYSDPESAYKSIIKFGDKYIKKSHGNINRINNPCNTEFVGRSTQQNIVGKQSIGVTVEVNA